jgi:hypothetical protein
MIFGTALTQEALSAAHLLDNAGEPPGRQVSPGHGALAPRPSQVPVVRPAGSAIPGPFTALRPPQSVVAGSRAAPAIQREPCSTSDTSSDEHTRMAGAAAQALELVGRGAGQALDTQTRSAMEARLGEDLSDVRIHTDEAAAQSALAMRAKAYTIGGDIVFGPGAYAPATSEGRRTLTHELVHVQQQRRGRTPGTGSGIAIGDPGDSFEREAQVAADRAPRGPEGSDAPYSAYRGGIQRAPDDEVEVTLVELSRSESELLFYDWGIRLPGSPPRVRFGDDGPIPLKDQKAVQLAFDLAYETAASPSFAAKFGEFQKKMDKKGAATIPGLADLSQQKYLGALSRMTIHLADTSKNATIKDEIKQEGRPGETLPIAGFTPVGSSDVYIRAFALTEGREALASLILHESVHVAGMPPRPIDSFMETIMEVAIHGFEASAGLPLSHIIGHAAAIRDVKPHGQGLEFEVSVTKADDLPADTVQIEIFDGNRQRVFSREHPKARFTSKFVWNGHDDSGRPTEPGIHSIRVVAGAALIAAHDYVLRRGKK